MKLIKKSLLALVSILVVHASTLAVAENHPSASHEAAEGGDHTGTITHNGANLTLFPKPEADPSKIARPAKPQLLTPEYRAKITADSVTLKWSEVASADAYHLQVATDPNFKWLVVNEEAFKSNSFDVKGLEKGKHYFWRVAALKSNNEPTFMKGWFSLSTFETP